MRLDNEFEAAFCELYAQHHEERFVPGLQTLNTSLTALLRAEFPEARVLRMRVEQGRIKDRNRALLKARSQKYAGRIHAAADIFDVLTDFVGTRVTCNTVSDAYAVLTAITKAMDGGCPERLFRAPEGAAKWCDDYIAKPKDTGYRAINCLVCVLVPAGTRFEPLVCEVQIRTLLQHAWGELTHEDTYKPGVNPPELVVRVGKRLADHLAVMDDMAEDIRAELDTPRTSEGQEEYGETVPVALELPPMQGLVEPTAESPGSVAEALEGEALDGEGIRTLAKIENAYRQLFGEAPKLSSQAMTSLQAEMESLEPFSREEFELAMAEAAAFDQKLSEVSNHVLTDFGKLRHALRWMKDPDSADVAMQDRLQVAERFGHEYVEGAEMFGTVVSIGMNYALVQLPPGDKGILHAMSLKHLAPDHFVDVRNYLKLGATVKVRVLRAKETTKTIELALA
jgi:ppGpp synthetase/RelA/SpoT-type nucleotidyltranferase